MGDGEPYRFKTLLWMGSEGAVLGHTVGDHGELIGLAAESLRSTIERPMFGKPHARAPSKPYPLANRGHFRLE